VHLIPLGGRWSLWRWICVRGAGFPFDMLDSLASPALAGAADRLGRADPAAGRCGSALDEYQALFSRSRRQLGRALRGAAADPRVREAITWQNRRALEAGIAAVLRRDVDGLFRTGRDRANAALVARYLQRYCAKNDTIGFFGPAGWAEIREGIPTVHVRPAPDGVPARRTVYFESWAVRALADRYGVGLRPWLAPRRSPQLDVTVDATGGWLHLPFAPPVRISAAAAYTLKLADGVRTASDVVAAVLATPGARAADADEVYAILHRLADQRRITWTLEVPPGDLHPERTVRAKLEELPDGPERTAALAALDELVAARDAVAGASGETRAAALGALDATFERLTSASPTRRAGQTYAGRTLVYEECLRADEVTFGPSILDPIREPLSLLLESARWFTAAGAALVNRACLDIYRARGGGVLPFAEFWLLAHELVFDLPGDLIRSLVRALQNRWAPLLGLPTEARRTTIHSRQIADGVRTAFAAARPGWAAAVHHSPDLMLGAPTVEAIRAGDVEWVLGELHPGTNTLHYASRVAYHPDPAALRRAAAGDVGSAVVLAPSGERGTPARQSNGLTGPDDVWFVFAGDSNGYDPARAVTVGECDVVESGGRLVVRQRYGPRRLDLVEVVADAIAHQLVQHFRIAPPAAHTPRVSIDRLVVLREAWTLTPPQVPFAEQADTPERFVAARRWAAEHGFPRYVFVRTSGESKPVFVDLASLASVDLLARAVRRARQVPDARVTVTEMLPGPDRLWLSDGNGRRYTCELRVCAVDTTGRREPAAR
jgi:hypothetical protein